MELNRPFRRRRPFFFPACSSTMPAVSPDASASTARRKGLLVLRSRGQASRRTPRPRARFQACAAAGLAARPCHRGETAAAPQCGRALAFSLCGWQTGWRHPLSELRAPLPDGALRAKKWTMGRGADYASWRALQHAAARWAGWGVLSLWLANWVAPPIVRAAFAIARWGLACQKTEYGPWR